MEQPKFDAAETIGGFALVKIKRAITLVGILDDRDDVKGVADALACPRRQAEQVLAALHRRGLVVPTAKKSQWETTPLGRELAYHWHPPPKLEPVIALDDGGDDDADEGDRAINEIFDAVPCSLLRTEGDDDVFEEADLNVGVFVEYASARVIEVNVTIPDDYDDRESGAVYETSVYLGVEDAKRFAKALQTAIERGEAELARRTRSQPAWAEKATAAARAAEKKERKEIAAKAKAARDTAMKAAAAERAAAKATEAAARDAERTRKREERELAATLKEVSSGSTRRTE